MLRKIIVNIISSLLPLTPGSQLILNRETSRENMFKFSKDILQKNFPTQEAIEETWQSAWRKSWHSLKLETERELDISSHFSLLTEVNTGVT